MTISESAAAPEAQAVTVSDFSHGVAWPGGSRTVTAAAVGPRAQRRAQPESQHGAGTEVSPVSDWQ